ncbi:FG-GAP-like repeat-containing protein [Dokdonella sp.]|uniref:FG-GAP-like repeat-containing protein n=1 Tax=Dokdonella sp. TaxID=2291710 RepID=UPI002F41A8B3
MRTVPSSVAGLHLSKAHWSPLLSLVLGLGASSSAFADTNTLTVANTTKGTSNRPVTMLFPVTRSGDLVYEAVLDYHTVDGTALAGTDYTATTGRITIPAGATTATIPVTLSAQAHSGPDYTFQLVLDSADRIWPAPDFASQQSFATGAGPFSVAVADVNGDGKSDLIVANYFGGSLVSVLLNTTAPGATTPSFAAQVTFATGSGPHSVTTADVNGDGKPDLIVANFDANTISVLLNTTVPGATTPGFAAQRSFAAGAGPICVTAADINGDGKADLLLTNFGGNTVSVLLNTTAPGATTPGFAARQTFTTGANPFSVAAADVNGDGKPDLIVTNANSSGVSVLLNTTVPGATTPSFAAQQAFATGSNNQSVTVAEINGDGKPDLIVANFYDGTVSVLLNTTAPGATTPSFATQQAFTTGLSPRSATATDVNNDGKSDLIVANSDSNSVSVLLNTTAPGAITASFATQQTFATGDKPVFVTVGDVNGDGKPDLIVANDNGNSVSVQLNSTAPGAATPSYTAQQAFATGAGPRSVAVADVNGDGKPDLIVANDGGNTVSVLRNATAPGAPVPSFAAEETFATGAGPQGIAVADINGDGKPDLIVANAIDNTASVLLNTTSPGAATPSFASEQVFSTGAGPRSVAVADVDGDGKPDVIVANANGNTVSVLLNTTAPGAATPSFAIQQAFATGAGPRSVAIANVNGDGKPDLIVANFNDNTISILLGTTVPGATTPSFAAQQTFAAGSGPISVTAADTNGDGKPDLIVANRTDNTVSVLLNTTAPNAATPGFAIQHTFATGVGPVSVTVGEIDGDGKRDLIVANYGDDTVSVLFNTTAAGATTPSFATQQTFATGVGPVCATTANVNGDGKPDLIVSNFGSGSVSVMLNTQYQTLFAGSPATGTIVHDYIFENGFE